MSESYGAAVPNDTATRDASESLETAKHEASDLKDTAVSEAGHVAETAKGEAKAVAREVKYQAKDLYAQTQRELKDQAQVQQHRVAVGLRSVSDELDSMTANAENPGLAADLLGQVSTRLSGAASWLGDRDPSAVLSEVKSFARRKPGTFILGAAILGIVAGRLDAGTRRERVGRALRVDSGCRSSRIERTGRVCRRRPRGPVRHPAGRSRRRRSSRSRRLRRGPTCLGRTWRCPIRLLLRSRPRTRRWVICSAR